LVDGRSAEGRFIRQLEAQLVEHLGGKPSVAERLLIDRIIRMRLQMETLDQKLASGAWTDHDRRTYAALLNASRLHIRELGLKPSSAREALSLRDYISQMHGAKAADRLANEGTPEASGAAARCR